MSNTTKPELAELLNIGDKTSTEPCIACYEDTDNSTKCCKAAICKDCYLRWLYNKRQCMHCKEDQCSFDVWVEHFRIEQEFDPHEYLHELVNGGENAVLTADVINPQLLLNTIAQHLQEATGQQVFLEDLDELPNPNEPFEFQYGYTIHPENGGPGMTITNTVDYNPGQDDIFNQIHNFYEQFQNHLQNIDQNQINPAPLQQPQQQLSQHGVQPPPDTLPQGMMWPWNGPTVPHSSEDHPVPPQCTQQ